MQAETGSLEFDWAGARVQPRHKAVLRAQSYLLARVGWPIGVAAPPPRNWKVKRPSRFRLLASKSVVALVACLQQAFPGRAAPVEMQLPAGAAVPVGELVDADTHLAMLDDVTGDMGPAGFDEGKSDSLLI